MRIKLTKNETSTYFTEDGALITHDGIYLGRIYGLNYCCNHDCETISLAGCEIQSAIDTMEPYTRELECSLARKIMIWGRLKCNISLEGWNLIDEDIDLVKRALSGCTNSQQKLRKDFASYMALFLEELITEEALFYFDPEEDEGVKTVKSGFADIDVFPIKQAYDIARVESAKYL